MSDSARAKKIIAAALALAYPHAEVTVHRCYYGRGTARGWLHVVLKAPDQFQWRPVANMIEQTLLAEKLCSTYWPDFGPGSEVTPCIAWESI